MYEDANTEEYEIFGVFHEAWECPVGVATRGASNGTVPSIMVLLDSMGRNDNDVLFGHLPCLLDWENAKHI